MPEPYRVQSDNKFSNVELDGAAVDYVALVNDQDVNKIHYVLRKDSGIVNSGYAAYTATVAGGKLKFTWKTADRPKFEYILFGGAIVDVYKIVGDRMYIRMLEVGGIMPTSKLFPPVHRFRSIDEFDVLETLPFNAVMFCRKGDSCWINKSHLRKL